jgi:hypothetical protein
VRSGGRRRRAWVTGGESASRVARSGEEASRIGGGDIACAAEEATSRVRRRKEITNMER